MLRLPQKFSSKEYACDAGHIGDMGSVPESARSPGEGHGKLLQYSCLRYSKDRRILQATVYEAAKSQT